MIVSQGHVFFFLKLFQHTLCHPSHITQTLFGIVLTNWQLLVASWAEVSKLSGLHH